MLVKLHYFLVAVNIFKCGYLAIMASFNQMMTNYTLLHRYTNI